MLPKFYKCSHCGQIIAKVNDTNVKVVCCNEEMQQLIPGTVEASREKHIPVYHVENQILKINIGSINHPMTEAHLIEWVFVQTSKKNIRVALHANMEPTVNILLENDEKVEKVLSYCNLHGLWEA